MTEQQSGAVDVKYISAHSNHEPGPIEDAFVPLPASTKETISMKLSVGIPIERIMEGIHILLSMGLTERFLVLRVEAWTLKVKY